MTFWTLDRLGAALADHLQGARPRGVTPLGPVATDTRTLVGGDVFVALVGARHDAHDHLDEAVARGAAALVVADASRVPRAGVPTFVVDDTTRALGALGRYRRRAWGGVVVAVAGSNGKTSTTALLAAATAELGAHATRGNLNNQVGVPLTLLAIPDAATVAIVEVGTNAPGEVAALRALVEPDVAVLTSIGEEHLEGLGDLAGVLREEGAIFDGVATAVVPAAQPEIGEAARARAGRVLVAGLEAGDVHAEAWGLGADGHAWLAWDGARLRVPLPGAHNARNAVLAVAVARLLGADLPAIAAAWAAMPPVPMRSAVEPLGGLLLVNDAYNANPPSVREALALLAALGDGRPRVAVLGSMLELGAHAGALHRELAERALASDAHLVCGVGLFAEALDALAPGSPRVLTAPDAEALWPQLASRLPPDAVVLLKGSRGTRLERLVPHLRAFAGLAPAPAATH